MKLPEISSAEALADLVNDIGFLPFFRNEIPGFSLEDCAASDVWFPEHGEGVWEWKGPVIRIADCAYGKFFQNRAGFISRKWFPDFANYRRNGYDMDVLYDDGMARRTDLQVWSRDALKEIELWYGNGIINQGCDGEIENLRQPFDFRDGWCVFIDLPFLNSRL